MVDTFVVDLDKRSTLSDCFPQMFTNCGNN